MRPRLRLPPNLRLKNLPPSLKNFHFAHHLIVRTCTRHIWQCSEPVGEGDNVNEYNTACSLMRMNSTTERFCDTPSAERTTIMFSFFSFSLCVCFSTHLATGSCACLKANGPHGGFCFLVSYRQSVPINPLLLDGAWSCELLRESYGACYLDIPRTSKTDSLTSAFCCGWVFRWEVSSQGRLLVLSGASGAGWYQGLLRYWFLPN